MLKYNLNFFLHLKEFQSRISCFYCYIIPITFTITTNLLTLFQVVAKMKEAAEKLMNFRGANVINHI